MITARRETGTLDPLYPAFKRIKIGKPGTVETDLRLIKPV